MTLVWIHRSQKKSVRETSRRSDGVSGKNREEAGGGEVWGKRNRGKSSLERDVHSRPRSGDSGGNRENRLTGAEEKSRGKGVVLGLGCVGRSARGKVLERQLACGAFNALGHQ